MREDRKKRRRRVKRIKICLIGMFAAVILLIIYLVSALVALICKTAEYTYKKEDGQEDTARAELLIENVVEENEVKSEQELLRDKLETYAQEHGFSVEEYTEEWIELLEKNPETEDFVLNYPLRKGTYVMTPLEDALHQTEMPLFLQWDSRWGYFVYGDKPMGMTGCGPTCLSMVAVHLLQNPQMTPLYIAEFAQQNGFYVEGTGTDWAMMTQGAAELGLYAKEVPLGEQLVMQYLLQGKPIICAMGAGDFTENGHFIVFAGIKDGKIQVNDPNSRIRSEKLWRFEDIKCQIKNMWVYSVR